MKENNSTEAATDSMQAVIEVYKKDVDRTLIRQNLKLTVEERVIQLMNFVKFIEGLREAGKRLREKD